MAQPAVTRHRNNVEHNAKERRRRTIIKIQVKKLQESLPKFKQQTGRRLSRISIVRNATSYIQQTNDVNAKLRDENVLLANKNTTLEREIADLEASKVTSATDELQNLMIDNSNSDESSTFFDNVTHFEDDIREFMMEDILNSQSEFWSLSQEFEQTFANDYNFTKTDH